MISKDTYLHIGKGHRICQDYALTDQKDHRLILSDGCSTAPHTDFGARILAHKYLKSRVWYCTEGLREATYALELPKECLTATLMSLEFDEWTNGFDVFPYEFKIQLVGDGHWVSREKYTHQLEMHSVSFVSGAPYYLAYALDDEKRRFLKEFGDLIVEDGGKPESLFEKYPDGIITKTFSCDKYDLVAIFSDGLGSFRGPEGEIPVKEIVDELLAFKGYAGEFVQRRCRKAFEVFAQKKWVNYDDFSMGAIAVGEKSETNN